MKETPILMCAEMVRATLEGRKTNTRRVVKFPGGIPPGAIIVQNGDSWRLERWPRCDREMGNFDRLSEIKCPYGKPGDRLWVRETFKLWDYSLTELCAEYAAGGDDTTHVLAQHESKPRDLHRRRKDGQKPWRPSIYLPRWASRLSLEVVLVRVQRVQDISEEDALAEGITWPDRNGRPYAPPVDTTGMSSLRTAGERFSELWDSLNAERDGGKYAWSANPWVWAITFKRV